MEEIEKAIDETVTMVLIQRSKGYSTRKSLTVDTIGEICRIVKKKNPNCICFVDNCYGEFVEDKEPLEAGADIIAGSLIKNPGGGIVEAGGYIAGKARLVERAANRLTAPGIGSEGGAMFNQHRLMFQGLFMAPSVVSEAVKGAVLAAKFLMKLVTIQLQNITKNELILYRILHLVLLNLWNNSAGQFNPYRR